MEIELIKASLEDAPQLHAMQVQAFMPLLERYQDFDTSPANESLEKVVARIAQPTTDYYLIHTDGQPVGSIRIVRRGEGLYRVSPVFVLPAYQGRGIAQRVFGMVEAMYADAVLWELDTILQEAGNCYLYEKLGYRQMGETHIVNPQMTIVFYEKPVTAAE